MGSRCWLLDSCSILNFYASAHFESILSSLDGEACIVDYVLRESQYIRTSLENGEEGKESVPLDNAVGTGVLRVLELRSDEEFERFLALAVRLDDGEAATLAVAVSTAGVLITDDRKAITIAGELSVPVLTTLDILYGWAENTGQSQETIREALVNIRFQARYVPGKGHPLQAWWRSMLDSGELP